MANSEPKVISTDPAYPTTADQVKLENAYVAPSEDLLAKTLEAVAKMGVTWTEFHITGKGTLNGKVVVLDLAVAPDTATP